MRKILKLTLLTVLIIVILPNLIMAKQNNGFSIIGQLNGLKNGDKVWLYLYPDKKKPICFDSTEVKTGMFKFKGYLKEGTMPASLSFLSHGQYFMRFINLDNTTIKVGGRVGDNLDLGQSITVEGSPLMEDAKALGSAIGVWSLSKHELYGIFSKGYLDKMRDSIGYNQQVMDAVMDTKQVIQNALKSIITKNYSQYQAMPMIFNMYHDLIGYESYWPEFFNTFDEKIKNTYYGKLMKQRLTYCIGNVAPVFASTTPEGQPLSSKEVIGKSKLTIIDFWASWCAYCREEARDFLIPLYQKYHERGLNIVGVSLDDDSSSWKKAISDDKYPWYQVSSLKGHDEPVSKLFEAHTPGNILIDGQGKIVAWNILDPLELEWYINKYLLR